MSCIPPVAVVKYHLPIIGGYGAPEERGEEEMKLHLVVGCPTRASTSSCFLEYSTRQLREVSHSWIVSKVQGLLQGDRGGLTLDFVDFDVGIPPVSRSLPMI